MAELADAEDLKSSGVTSLWVRVPLPAPAQNFYLLSALIYRCHQLYISCGLLTVFPIGYKLHLMAWLIVVLSYLIGAIPTAYIAGRLTAGVDIRRIGDDNMGAANAYRELSHKIGVIVFFIDAFKGALVIFLAQLINLPQIIVLLCGVAAVVGHNWPVYLRFRGGRGESTAIGILYVLVPIPMLIMTVPAFLTLILKKNVILASAVLFIPLSLLGWWLHAVRYADSYSISLPCLVGLTHFLRTRKQLLPG